MRAGEYSGRAEGGGGVRGGEGARCAGRGGQGRERARQGKEKKEEGKKRGEGGHSGGGQLGARCQKLFPIGAQCLNRDPSGFAQCL